MQRLTEAISRPSTITLVDSLLESPIPSIQCLLTDGRSSADNATAKPHMDIELEFLESRLTDNHSQSSAIVFKAQLLGIMATCSQNLAQRHIQLLKAAALLALLSQSVDQNTEADALRDTAAIACLTVLKDVEGEIDFESITATVTLTSRLIVGIDDLSQQTTERVPEGLPRDSQLTP
jgi:hypothetical protein